MCIGAYHVYGRLHAVQSSRLGVGDYSGLGTCSGCYGNYKCPEWLYLLWLCSIIYLVESTSDVCFYIPSGIVGGVFGS